MLRFTSLASGSSGNATLVEARGDRDGPCARVLVDCGLGPRRLAAALSARGVAVADLDAVFVTHEHSDHVAGVFALQRRWEVAVWTSAGTWSAATAGREAPRAAHIAHAGEAISIGPMTLHPFAVPHDAAEPLQLVCEAGGMRLGILTDIGEPTADTVRALQGCDALLLECNHDRTMLADGPYPIWLKRRIGGARGHLANDQAAGLLDACRHEGLRHVVAAHLSRQNNRPDLALASLQQALGDGAGHSAPALHVADGDCGCPWIEIG